MSGEEETITKLFTALDPLAEPGVEAPTRLKARTYSTLTQRQAASGPLLSLTETKAVGRGLCVFEQAACLVPIGEKAKSLNFCRVCHARWLAEKLENAPIYWGDCPYVEFQK
jgi:hypothetical protein